MEYTFEKLPSGYIMRVYVEVGTLEIEITKLTDARDALSGILSVYFSSPEKEAKLYIGKFNVLASRTRTSVAKHLSQTAPRVLALGDKDFLVILEKFCQLVVEDFYTPEPPVQIEPLEDSRVEFVLYPFLPEAHPVLLYAPGGFGKSFFAMYLSMFVQNGIAFDAEHDVKTGNVLYVDWEVDLREARRRFTMLSDNFLDYPDLKYPFYKRASLPLKDEIDDILLWVAKNDAKLVILDSAGPALGGDINDASKVIELFSQIRKITSLGATVLLLTHVSKAEKESEENRTPLGSVYFENLSRLTWELKSDVDDNIVDIALYPRKSNFGKLPALGFRLVFSFGKVYFEEIDAETVGTGNIKSMIKSILLKNSDGLTAADLSKILGISKQKIFVHLSQMKKRGEIDNVDGKWTLVLEGREDR